MKSVYVDVGEKRERKKDKETQRKVTRARDREGSASLT
jgi:hypothetical protein